MKIFNIQRILLNNYRFSIDHIEFRQVYLINALLFSLIVFCLFFSAVNIFIYHLYLSAVTNGAASLCAVAIFYYFHKTDNVKLVSYLSVILMLLTLAVFLAIVQHHFYALYWISIFPPVVYFLLGRRNARIVSGIYSAYLLYFIFTNYKSWEPTEFNGGSIFNIVFATIILALVISYFELSRKETEIALALKNKELIENKDQLRLILDSTAEAIYGVDINDTCTFCNMSCLKMLGYTQQEELLGKNIHQMIHHTKKSGMPFSVDACKIHRSYREGIGTYADDEIFWRADGTHFDVEYHSYPQFKNGKVVGAVVTFMDNTEKRMREEQIKFLSSRDPLTGLLNRRSFEDWLKKIDSPRYFPISIIFGDVNGLKLTNDVFGHTAGDNLIKKSANVLEKVCRNNDIIARVGGDEFVIILPQTKPKEAENMIDKMKEELAKEQVIATKCSMSLGYHTKSDNSQSIEQTMENAENEMYKSKTMNRKSIDSDMINTIIASLYARSPREELHSINVGMLCQSLGEAMHLPDTEVKKLKDAGFLHDIGKIVLSDGIINNENYTEKEKKEMEQHPILGYRILNLFTNTLDLAEGVYCHHENWDGTGFPKGLKGNEIPKLSRIISVAGSYDILTNHFNIHSLSKETALKEMKHLAGKKLDPEITEVFIKMMTSI